MNTPASITVTPVFVADLQVERERMPIYVHLIEHPDARVLVDTGMTEPHPWLVDMEPRLRPLNEQDIDLAASTSWSTPTCTVTTAAATISSPASRFTFSARSLTTRAARTATRFREWVDSPGVRYVPVDGELELLPGVRLVPAPGHTRGIQRVTV